MDYEKKYKEALERAKILHNEPTGGTERIVCEQIFPELIESDDERIRNWCISHFKGCISVINGNDKYTEFLSDKVLVWLEKQGEQKSIDKIDPKFNIGDIICDKLCTTLNKDAQPNLEIVDIRNGMYICDKGSFPVSQQDEYVLVSKRIDTKLNDDSVSNELRTASFAHAKKEILNHTFPNNEEFELAYTFEKGAKWQAAQESNFCHHEVDLSNCSEEYRKAYYDGWNNCNQQHSQLKAEPTPIEWSEEDIATISRVISIVKWAACSDHSHPILNDEGAAELVERLKSLKDRSTWKPSEAQMIVINEIITDGHLLGANEKILKDLREQLMKLK